jgi:hypothetical protein
MEWNALDDLFDTVAMRFSRFDTRAFTFSSLAPTISGLTLSASVPINNIVSPCDHLDFYVGMATEHALYNLHAFFQYNGWVSDRMWQYDVVIVVGKNTLSGITVDVPVSLFPWCIDYFGAREFCMPFTQGLVSTHRLTAACIDCGRLKRACQINREGDCNRCAEGTCRPNVGKEIENMRFVFLKHLTTNRHVLCPGFQYLLSVCGNANGYTKIHSAADTLALGDYITITGRHICKEDVIRTTSQATQLVNFKHGTLHIVEANNMGKRLGFVRTANRGKYALSVNIPGFGMADPHHSYSLLNSALQSPGEFFFADALVRGADLEVSPARIQILAQWEDLDSLWVMVGWV